MTLFDVIRERRSLWDVVLHLKIMRWTEKLEADRATIRDGMCGVRGNDGDGVGLVPGADTVISDPFDGLER